MEKLTLANAKFYAQEILKLVELAEGEITPEHNAALMQINDKIVAGCFAVDSLRQEIADTDAMIKELQARKKRLKKSEEFVTGAVLSTMDATGTKKIESFKKFTAVNKPGRVEIVDAEKIPASLATFEIKFNIRADDTFFTYLMELCNELDRHELYTLKRNPDKTAIKNAIKAGEIVPGAQLIEDEKRLAIK